MSIIRAEWEVQVLGVLVQAGEQADLYDQDADHLRAEYPRSADLASDMAQRRRRFVAELEAALKPHDVLPRSADPEKEVMDDFFDNLKSMMSPDEGASLLESRLVADETLQESMDAALAEDETPDDVRSLLTRAKDALAQDCAELRAFINSRG